MPDIDFVLEEQLQELCIRLAARRWVLQQGYQSNENPPEFF